MKKMLLPVVITSIVASSGAMASDWFAGVEAGYVKNEMKITSQQAFDKADTHTGYGIRFGKYLNDNFRLYGVITTGDADETKLGNKHEAEQQTYLISADYFFGDGNLRPFVGMSLGADSTDFEATVGNNKYDGSDTSFAYGVQTGINYRMDNFDLELTYRYLGHNTSVKEGGIDYLQNGIKMQNKRTQQLMLGASFRF